MHFFKFFKKLLNIFRTFSIYFKSIKNESIIIIQSRELFLGVKFSILQRDWCGKWATTKCWRKRMSSLLMENWLLGLIRMRSTSLGKKEEGKIWNQRKKVRIFRRMKADTAATSNKNTMLTKKSTISTKFIIIIVVKKIGKLINSKKNNKKEAISRKNRAQDSSLKANNTGMSRNKTSLHLMLLFNSIPSFSPIFINLFRFFLRF